MRLPSGPSETSPPNPFKVKSAPRPVVTYIAFAVVVVGAIWMEFGTMDRPRMTGGSFWLFAPVMVLGYGLDWARLARPDAVQVAWALILCAAAAHVVVYGMVHDWLPTVLSAAAVATGLIAIRWAVASIPPRLLEGTFIGCQDGRWLFVAEERSWALASNASLEVTIGRRYFFRAKLEEKNGKKSGPYRCSPRARGTLLEIASKPSFFVGRRHERAWNYSRRIVTVMVLITVALVLPHLEL